MPGAMGKSPEKIFCRLNTELHSEDADGGTVIDRVGSAQACRESIKALAMERCGSIITGTGQIHPRVSGQCIG